MSAFNVHPEHIIELAAYAGHPGRFGESRIPASWLFSVISGHGLDIPRPWTVQDAVAEILRAENARSVAYRYNEPASTEPVRAEVRPPRLPAVAILKLIDCLEYQSCECPDWEQTAAFRILKRLRSAAISELDGYDSAPWEYCGAAPPSAPQPDPAPSAGQPDHGTKGADGIRFLKHYVTDGTNKARVYYSRRTLADGRDEVAIYAKEYGQDLAAVMLDGRSIPGMAYRDDTDTMTDYFCRASVTIAQECELFKAAAARVPAPHDYGKDATERRARAAVRPGPEITATDKDGRTYYKATLGGVEYVASLTPGGNGRWSVWTRRLALGRSHYGNLKTFDDISRCRAFAQLPHLLTPIRVQHG